MRNLDINKGYKEYSVNNDENTVIRVRTTDFSLIDKLKHFEDKIVKIASDLEDKKNTDNIDAFLAALKKADEKVRAELDEIFDSAVSEAVFGKMNCLSFAGGQPVALNFLEAIIPEIETDLKAENQASQEKISKYTAAAKQFK